MVVARSTRCIRTLARYLLETFRMAAKIYGGLFSHRLYLLVKLVFVLLGRLLRVDLITLEVEMSVRLSVRPSVSVRTFVHKKFVRFHEIWCVHRGR